MNEETTITEDAQLKEAFRRFEKENYPIMWADAVGRTRQRYLDEALLSPGNRVLYTPSGGTATHWVRIVSRHRTRVRIQYESNKCFGLVLAANLRCAPTPPKGTP